MQAVYLSPALSGSERHLNSIKRMARNLTVAQASQTAEFLLLYGLLAERGLRPIITKGIMCRRLYPYPDQRVSVDEDMLIDPKLMPEYHRAMLERGFELVEPDCSVESDHEIAYSHPDSHLYIEIHKTFFPPDSSAYGSCNAVLEGAPERCEEVVIEGVPMLTPAPTDHLLYLILHAYKHFLHGGVGIRQTADICMFAEHYADRIDRARIESACNELHISKFVGALFRIGERRLGFDGFGLFESIDVDESPLLSDILSGGLYGAKDVNRLHSSTLTLEAVAADRAGKKRKGALHSVFLPAKALSGRYRYLKKAPWLLPAAWTQRIWNYAVKRDKDAVRPSESLKIGRERIELLKTYDIIER